jgi:DNA polymerase II small subunit/DNA polymerase delta subunit B
VADTQLGSRFQQLTHLCTFYKLCESLGISQVLHAGDLVDGQRMYKGQEFELFMHGADAQRDYAINQYPRIKGIESLIIGGNHDESHWKHAGTNICEAIAKERDDIKYLGMYGAYFNIGGITFYLYHGGGGVAYARSYKLQRFIEQLSPQQKPQILAMGHYHCQDFLPMYRNVVAMQLPCFQSQTPYLKQKGLYPEIGGVILEFVIDETVEPIGLASFTPTFVPYYRPIENDF